jgi:hypothetical protein
VEPDSKSPAGEGQGSPLPPVNEALSSNDAPPPLPTAAPRSSKQFISLLLSLFVGIFLVDAVVSLLDDSLILFFDSHALTGIRSVQSLLGLLMALLVYGLMGLTPQIPKRLFLPLALFNPLAGLIVVPFLIYAFGRIQQVSWAISFYQVLLGLCVLYLLNRRKKLGWPLIAEDQIQGPFFSLRNVSVFLLVNLFVLVPAVMVYLAVCASLAVNHYSDGFLALRPEGLTVQVRKYVRPDGKTIQLVPMAHIGETSFYRELAQSFPTNSTVLMEGVTDTGNLLTNKISYEKIATSIGVSEQQKEFRPRGQVVMADVDVGQFQQGTIDFLNLVMRVQAKGMNEHTMDEMMGHAAAPRFQEQFFEDVLRKRNQHLLKKIETQLLKSNDLIVPWGAAHMPEIAQGILKAGFRVSETREAVAIRFRSVTTR